MATKSPKKTKNWKDIDQAVKRKEMSDVTRRQLLATRVKLFIGVVVVLVCVVGLVKLSVFSDAGAELLAKAGDKLPIKRVEIQNDGVLSDEFILDYLELEGDIDLLSLDLDEMQKSLLSIPQVTEVAIERQLPDGLWIMVEEREPIVRIRGRDADNEIIQLLVDRDGVPYTGIGYDQKFVKSLPALGGVVLKKAEGGFEAIEGIREVDALLSQAKLIAPHLYRTWKVVSLERSPQILVKSTFAKEIVFNPGEYHREIARLDYILDYYKGNMVTQVASVDLTLGEQVPVKATFQ